MIAGALTVSLPGNLGQQRHENSLIVITHIGLLAEEIARIPAKAEHLVG